MNDYPELLNAVSTLARDMEKLQAVAVAQYTPEVEALIATVDYINAYREMWEANEVGEETWK